MGEWAGGQETERPRASAAFRRDKDGAEHAYRGLESLDGSANRPGSRPNSPEAHQAGGYSE